MLLQDQQVRILTKLGFTPTQVRLYLTLLRIGKAQGRKLADQAGVSRSIVHRELDELQKRGIVEKEITQPYTFRAVPIDEGLKILLKQKFDEADEIRDETEILLQKTRNKQKTSLRDEEYRLVLIGRKERIIQRIKRQHDTAKVCVDILTTLPRLLQVLNECLPNVEQSLSRGIQFRVALDNCEQEIGAYPTIEILISKPNFSLRVSSSSLAATAVVFDRKEALFCFYPAKPLAESPVIWTNHSSFLAMCECYFEEIWRSAKEYNWNNEKVLISTR
jgi:sugar-specific transcriptional regulator TrmB